MTRIGISVRRLAVLGAVVALVLAAFTAPGNASRARTARYIVVFKGGVEQPGVVAGRQASRYGAKVGFVYRAALSGYSATLSAGAVQRLRSDRRVAYVERDGARRAS